MIDPSTLRERTLRTLAGLGFTEPPPLPLLDEDLSARAAIDLARRVNALHLLYAITLTGPEALRDFQATVAEQPDRFSFTGAERRALASGEPSEADLLQFAWRKEAARALIWAGSLIDGRFMESFAECDFSETYHLIPPERAWEDFVRALTVRDEAELVRALDLLYCLHWYARNEPEAAEAGAVPVHPAVVVERRRALEWCLHPEQEWDEISLDT